MDALFGSDDDDDGCGTTTTAITAGNDVFIELMKIKPFAKKRQVNAVVETELVTLLHRRIAFVTSSLQQMDATLSERLAKAGFIFSEAPSLDELILEKGPSALDVLVVLDKEEFSATDVVKIGRLLVAGGTFISYQQNQERFPFAEWIVSQHATVFLARRRSVRCNTLGAIYWGATAEGAQLESERALIEEFSVPLSVAEKELQVLSDESHRRACEALQKHGLCVFCNLFPAPSVMQWGTAARGDMQDILAILRETRGIDLLRPGEGPRIENFHEMSMREALRCDIRNGKRLKTANLASCSCNSSSSSTSAFADLRHHPGLNEVLLEVMNPPGDPAESKGNWGRWNFEGAGPEGGHVPLTVGQVGAVMSLPGCADQTIHADTSHLYVHTQLPGHYYNLFLPAITGDDGSAELTVGQTAFVCGTHVLKHSAKVMTQHGGQAELNRRLVRPHLTAGDGLVFDCRILHFGLANQSLIPNHPSPSEGDDSQSAQPASIPGIARPLLYVNYHQNWFGDPKNWNDKEKLFAEE